MKQVGTYEAKTHLTRLLSEVAAGARITIHKHGHPVAMLVPPERSVQPVETIIQAIKDFRRGKTLGKVSLRSLIEAGRR